MTPKRRPRSYVCQIQYLVFYAMNDSLERSIHCDVHWRRQNIQGGPKKRGHSTFSQISRKLLKVSK